VQTQAAAVAAPVAPALVATTEVNGSEYLVIFDLAQMVSRS